jgi:predicted nucleic acid-binding protein
MKIFLDANVLISVLNKEYPVFPYSSRVLSLADHSGFRLFTSPTCLAIAFYFAEKKSGAAQAKRKIEILVSKLDIAATNKTTVLPIFKNKAIKDFEDGIQYYAALHSKCDCIVTEDRDDFYFSEIEILNSKDFLAKHLAGKKVN